jgi:hypothetical protein
VSPKSEKDLYEPIRRELEERFFVSGKVHLEVSADGRISETVKEKLDDVCLHIINFERLKPDIIGFLRTETKTGRGAGYYHDDMIIAEVKNEQIGITDIIQTKAYAEVFAAQHTFLVSSEPIPEEVKRFVKMKPGLLYGGPYGEIRLVQFDVDRETFVERSWYRESPFEEAVEEVEEEGSQARIPAIKTWDGVLKWADPSLRTLLNSLNKTVENEFPGIVHEPLSRWYAYYLDADTTKRKRFLALIAGKRALTCRIRVDPRTFKDHEKSTRELRGWFYVRLTGAEKAFTIASPSDIEKFLPLIRQSYDFVKRESAESS